MEHASHIVTVVQLLSLLNLNALLVHLTANNALALPLIAKHVYLGVATVYIVLRVFHLAHMAGILPLRYVTYVPPVVPHAVAQISAGVVQPPITMLIISASLPVL